MKRDRRISAYGVCVDGDDRVLLVRASARSNHSGSWLLPGGGIEHGEDPARAAVREVAEETGLRTEILGVRDVRADVVHFRERGVIVHFDRIVYDMAVRGGTLRDEEDGTTEEARWCDRDELGKLTLMPFTAAVLGLPESALPAPAPGLIQPRPTPPRPAKGQRFAAYGLVTDPDDRILLARIADRYPGAGRWHAPGGGTDFGEQPDAALLRELAEETDQVGVVAGLLAVSHRHNPRALGPEGRPIDWHTVRALYRVHVGDPTEPRVTEAAGGSTAEAAWFSRTDAARLPLTEIAVAALGDWGAE